MVEIERGLKNVIKICKWRLAKWKIKIEMLTQLRKKKGDIYLENTSLILIINNFIGLYVYIESLKINIMHTYIQGAS